MQETRVWSLGGKNTLEKVMATHSGILACRIPWTEGPDGLQAMGLQRVGHDWATNTFTFHLQIIEIYNDIKADSSQYMAKITTILLSN